MWEAQVSEGGNLVWQWQTPKHRQILTGDVRAQLEKYLEGERKWNKKAAAKENACEKVNES